MSEIKKEDTSAKEIIGDIKNIEENAGTNAESTTDPTVTKVPTVTETTSVTETSASGTEKENVTTVKVEGTDAASKADVKAEVKVEVKKETPKKEEPKKKEPEQFGKKDRIYTNTPKVVMHNDSVTIDLKGSGKEFDSGVRNIDAFKCAGKSFKFEFNRSGGKISGVNEESEQEAVARSLVALYETSTNLLT